MKALEAPDSMFLDAAEGWLGLGNWQEANQELEKIRPEFRTHPDFLKVRWTACAMAKNWDRCVEVGQSLVEAEPKDSFGWVNRSYALRRSSLGGLQAAYDALTPAADAFKEVEQVGFNLACYACQLGFMEAARQWLAKAFSAAVRHGTASHLKKEALGEVDLKPLWQEIASI
jgi:hypothetical protein